MCIRDRPYSVLGALVATYFRGFSNDIYFQIGLLVLIGLTAKMCIRDRAQPGAQQEAPKSQKKDDDVVDADFKEV